jgi:hypothetical protein
MKPLRIVLFICLVWFSPDIAAGRNSLSSLLPDPGEGWIKAETSESYDRKNIFDYLDGGAEIYLAYDFQQVIVQKYSPIHQDSLQNKSITVEIWQMKSSADAYGVFSLDREGENVSIGQNGVYGDGYLRFWKDVYFVKILQMGDISKETVYRLGKEISQKIRKEGRLPQLVQKTPFDSLTANSICFFHQKIILNDQYHISGEDRLNLSAKTDCVLADYRVCEDHLKLLLVKYPNPTQAKTVENNLMESHNTKETLSEDEKSASKERQPLGMDLLGEYLILVFEGKDKQNIKWLINSVKSAIDGSKNMATPKCFHFR